MGYQKTSDKISAIVSTMNGFLGVECLRDVDGFGITVSYWDSMESIDAWRKNLDHMEAKQRGRSEWYQEYTIRICKVEFENHFEITDQ